MKLSVIALVLILSGCSSTALPTRSLNSEQPVYVRDRLGMAHYKIQDGNIYSTRGPTAGQRVGRIK